MPRCSTFIRRCVGTNWCLIETVGIVAVRTTPRLEYVFSFLFLLFYFFFYRMDQRASSRLRSGGQFRFVRMTTKSPQSRPPAQGPSPSWRRTWNGAELVTGRDSRRELVAVESADASRTGESELLKADSRSFSTHRARPRSNCHLFTSVSHVPKTMEYCCESFHRS